MKPAHIVVASKNPDKVREVEDVLIAMADAPRIVRGLDWPDVPETGATLEDNALLKARAVAAATGVAALADDTGLEVMALGGAPGVNTARYAGEDATYDDNVDKLLTAMTGVRERSARFRTVVALVVPGNREVTARGQLLGVIAHERRGTFGFGYDPIFELPDGRTLAEVPEEEKNQISHRARALRALADALER